ncbi:SpoVR family protein, partial [Myxococcota bacterium]|nr:SpoVR family protein [Myxococcota bacterium]
IYELVINNDPSYAYLLASNEEVDQKMVMAHVYGHVDFFKNNYSFSHTNRKMMDDMANHGTKIRRYIDRYGVEKVEGFIDQCLSIENLIDRQSPYIRRVPKNPKKHDPHLEITDVPRIESDREYMKGYINPKEFIDDQRQRLKEERLKERRFPENPQRDILLFLMENAPLQNWQRDILAMLRQETYYFSPQGQTKIMNEGWASFWHATIMTQKAMDDSEVIDFADRHSATMGVQPGSINPYKLGLELYRDIEMRWNKGRYGREWEECTDRARLDNWDTGEGKGREKIFEVRKHYNDVTFIDEFLTREFASEQKLFNYDYESKSGDWLISDRDFQAIKKRLLDQITNFGQPVIDVVDANFENRGELLLRHHFQDAPLRQDYMHDTLSNILAIWGRPVALHTLREGYHTQIRASQKSENGEVEFDTKKLEVKS